MDLSDGLSDDGFPGLACSDSFLDEVLAATKRAESHRLPPASAEQAAVVQDLQAGCCVAVDSVAGSGKTTTMLLACSALKRRALVVTYNRALADGCNARIEQLKLNARCYTYHALVGRSAQASCKDDAELLRIVARWDKGEAVKRPPEEDLVLLDEVQDLRPSFAQALVHVLGARSEGPLQMMVVGDNDQLLYDFHTYGQDKATAAYLQHPKHYFGHLTEHGSENVMMLAQSIKSEKSPIMVQMNELSARGYCFLVRDHERGFENNSDYKNKTRVGTFCSSKGCEAEAVIVFGFDMRDENTKPPGNQMGVALSRARSRLYVVHGGKFTKGEFEPYRYFPCCGREDVTRASDEAHARIMGLLAAGVIDGNPPEETCADSEIDSILIDAVVTDFTHFSALELERFLQYATWEMVNGATVDIQYETQVQCERTIEDVSAIYGECVPLVMQWQRMGFCPKVEDTLIGPIVLDSSSWYSRDEFDQELERKECCPSKESSKALDRQFGGKKVKGRKLIKLVNEELRIVRQRGDGRVSEYRVKAMETQLYDTLIHDQLNIAKGMYEKACDCNTASWMYLANVCLAVGGFHEVPR